MASITEVAALGPSVVAPDVGVEITEVGGRLLGYMDRQMVLDLARDALQEIAAAPTQLGSAEVLHACGAPLDSLTFAVHASSRDSIYGWLDAWKRQGCPRPDPMMLALAAPDL